MRWEDLKDKKCEIFRRLTGVKKDVFNKMLTIIIESDVSQHKFKGAKRGKKSSLPYEDKLWIFIDVLPRI